MNVNPGTHDKKIPLEQRGPLRLYNVMINMRILRRLAFLLVFITAAGYAVAQPGWEDNGEIPDVKIEITKERQITLPAANRNFEKIPPRPSEPIKPPMTYTFQSFNFQAPQVNPQIRPLKLKPETSSDIYGNYVRVGYGNYASPLLEAYLNSRKDKNKLLSAHFYHNSSGKGPVDGKNSSNGTTGLSLSARSVGEDLSLAGNASFENRATTFYGYPSGMEVSKDTIKQAYKLFKLSGEVSNAKNADIAYRLGAGFNYLADKFTARETEVDLDFKSSYELDEMSGITLSAGYYAISRKDDKVEAKPRSLFVVAPSYAFQPMENLKVSAGLTVAFENDSIDSKNLHVYPDFKVSYPVSPSVDFVAYLGGGMEKVSLQSLSNENLWLAPNVPIFHTNKTIDFGAGIKARVGNKVSVHTGLALASLKNWYFFVNSPEDQAKFDVVYDEGSTKRTNFYAALSYAQSETAKFMLRGDYYKYDAGDLPEVWHRPNYKLTANASFNLYQKIIFHADLIAQGGMKAYDLEAGKTVSLKGAFDLNFKTEYLFSESFSAFLQFNNITSNKYPVFLHYPVRGFQLTAGITWSF
jgi:hypothetical protein